MEERDKSTIKILNDLYIGYMLNRKKIIPNKTIYINKDFEENVANKFVQDLEKAYFNEKDIKKQNRVAKCISAYFENLDIIPDSLMIKIMKIHPKYIKPYLLCKDEEDNLDLLGEWSKTKDNLLRIDELDKCGKNLMYYLVYIDNLKTNFLDQKRRLLYIRKLVELESNINIKFEGNKSLLHYIRIIEYSDGLAKLSMQMVEYRIKTGKEISGDLMKSTQKDYIDSYYNEKIEIAKLLIELKINITEDDIGRKPDILKYVEANEKY